ncbi:MAG: MDR family oxidoreductase [Rhodospirillales bacterium]
MAEFQAILLEKSGEIVSPSIQTLDASRLPDGEVTVRVLYSTLNYKDGLVLKGQGGLVRNYPHIPGIDLIGIVDDPGSSTFNVGDRVISTGWRVGEVWWGGYATLAKLKSEWLVKAPEGLSDIQCMAIGTAGFTAMQCVLALEANGVVPNSGEVLVTGAGGGVGSVAISILAGLGYEVIAVSGRPQLEGYLKDLGAKNLITREEISELGKRPLQSERFAGAVDTVGGEILAGVLPAIKYKGAAAICGLAGGAGLKTTVIPFILRGITMAGIDSVMAPAEERTKVWSRLAMDLPKDKLDATTSIVGLQDAIKMADEILAGQVRGRTVIDVNA